MSDDDQGSAPEPVGDSTPEDRTRTGRAVSARWRNRRRGVDAGALATQSATFAAGIGRSVIGRRLAGGTVAVADSAGLPARPPAAAWRMSEVEDDRRVDTPMPPDLSSLRDLMRAREAARRPVRLDLPARGLPMVAALGVSSTAGPRTGPLAAGVRYQPRSAMVDRPPEVAAASPLANPIAPDYQSQPTTAIAAAPSTAPAEVQAAPDDGLDALRRARAFREAQAAGERGGPGPADRDRPPPAGAAEAVARAEARTGARTEDRTEHPSPAPVPAGDAAPDQRAAPGRRATADTPDTPHTPTDRPAVPSPGRAGGIALATMLPLRRQRRLPTVPATGSVRPSVAGAPGRSAGTAGLPVGSPVAITTNETGGSVGPGASAAPVSGTSAAAAAAAAVRAAESGWQHWPTPAAALAHHLVDRRATGTPGPVQRAAAAAPASGAAGTATGPASVIAGAPPVPPGLHRATTSAGIVASGAAVPGTRWASGDTPPIALRPFGTLTGPRPQQPGATSPLPATTSLAPALRLVAGASGADAPTRSGGAAAPEVSRRATIGTAGLDTAQAPAADPRRIAAAIAAGEAPGTPTARAASAPAPTSTGTSAPASSSGAGRPASPASSLGTAAPGAAPTAGVGFPHWPPPAGALARPLRPAGVLRRRLAGTAARFVDADVDPADVDAAGALGAGVPGRSDAPGRPPAGGRHRPAASPEARTASSSSPSPSPSPSTRTHERPAPAGRRGPGTPGRGGTAPASAARWPHWPTPSGPGRSGRGDRPVGAHPVRPPAGAWAAPVDADIDLEPGTGWPGDRTEAPPRRARNHAEAAARFDDVLRRHRPDPLVDLPTPFVPLARALVGDRRVRVSVGRASREALAAAGHVAATVGTTIHLAQPLAPTAAHLDVVAHELTHVAAAPDRRAPRFFGDQEQDEEEGIADMIGRMARSILPASIGSLFGGGAPAAPALPSALATPTAPPAPAIPPMPTMPGAPPLPGIAPPAPPLPGIAPPVLPAPAAPPVPPVPPAPPMPAGAGTAGLPVGGASGFLQALSGSLAPGATPAPRPTPQPVSGGAVTSPPSPPPPPAAAAGVAGAPTSLTPPPGSVQQAPAASVDGSAAEHVGAWGGAPAGRPRTAAELGFPGSVPLSVRDTTVSSPAVLEEAEIRRIVALIERRVLAELDRRGGRGNGLGGSW